MKLDTTQKPEAVNEFMLAEYQGLADSRGREIERGQSYVNLFLTISSSVAAFLTLIGQFASGTFYHVSIWILSVLLLLGIISFLRVIERDIKIRKYGREMNRIRRYFVEIEPGIEIYLSYSIHDDKPTYFQKGRERVGLRSIVSLISSAAGATLVYLIFPLFWGTEVRIAIAAITLVVLLILHELYANSCWHAAEAKAEVRFPSESEQRSKTPKHGNAVR